MTYLQIDLFNKINKEKLENLFENWKNELSGLDILQELTKRHPVVELLKKFFYKGYLLGDFDIMNELKVLYGKFDIQLDLISVSSQQWELRMPDYTGECDESLFVVKSLEDGGEHRFEHGNLQHALETYIALFESGLSHKELKLEIWKYDEKTGQHFYDYDFVVDTSPKEV